MTSTIYLLRKFLDVQAKGGSRGNGNEGQTQDKLLNRIPEEDEYPATTSSA